MKQKLKISLFALILCTAVGVNLVRAVQDKEPIKETQSDTVAVTEELLKREGQLGPASPTIKMEDTAQFLVKKPYEEAEKKGAATPGLEPRPWWKSWFFWLDDEKKATQPETP